MKRPFALIGTVCFITAVILSNANVFTVSVTGFVALAVFLLSIFKISLKSKHLWVIFASFGVAVISVSMLFIMKDFDAVSVYDSETLCFSGTVINTEYHETYEKIELKIRNVGDKKEGFHAVTYSDTETGLEAGDRISAKGEFELLRYSNGNVKSMLSDNTYFSVNKMTDISVTGENVFRKSVGRLKAAYKTAVCSYLPNEIGSVAVGMTVGDRTGISNYLRNCFNYSGTAHLLVVSGLHLTIWTAFISDFIPVLRKRKIMNTAITLCLVVLYLALTGFSVSVVRAGIMILIIKLSKIFGRASDSLNSLGLSMSVLLIKNPFSVTSVSLLLSVGSTLGLILFAEKIHNIIYKSRVGKLITQSVIGRLAADSLAVSISVSVFTLPVFIIYFNMFPVLSFISNFFIIDLSSFLMVLTVSGVIMHFFGILPLAKCLFYFSGIITELIISIAEKIGMLRYSTVAVASRYFKAFLIFVVIFSVLFLFIRKFKTAQKSVLPIVLIFAFIFTAGASEYNDLSHPSVDAYVNDEGFICVVRDGYDCALLGTDYKKASSSVGDMLGRHNIKAIGCLFVTDGSCAGVSGIINDYPTSFVAFGESKSELIKAENYAENVRSITVGGVISVTAVSEKSCVIKSGSEDILISCDISDQNLLDFGGKYDIIILNKQDYKEYCKEAECLLKNDSSQIIVSDDNQITVYPDLRKIYYSESF